MKNFAITITRTCGSGGTTISKMIAEDLKIDLYDRKLLMLAAEDSGINERLFAAADEDTKKSLLYKVSKRVFDGSLIPPESDDFTSNDNLFAYQAKVLRELIRDESFVVIGRGADVVLKNFSNVLRVFLYAPFENCVEHEKEWESINTMEAKKRIAQVNSYREAYYKYHTGKEWRNPENYDLCLNSAKFGYEGCAALIEDTLDKMLKGELK